MSKKVLYANEIATANNFLEKHKDDKELHQLLMNLRSPYYIHSERWSVIYDYIDEHYPTHIIGDLVTGLTYYIED